MDTALDVFAAISDPTRRRMLTLLRSGERAAGDLAHAAPKVTQPAVSRHLRVLREAGLVAVRRDEQRWMYSLKREGFARLEEWLAHYRDFWPKQLDALGEHLDKTE